MDKTIKSIKEQFTKIEKDLELFKLKFLDIEFWQYIRFQIFNMILIKKNILENSYDKKKNLFFRYLKAFIYNIIFIFKNKSLFFHKKTQSNLIFNHSRKKIIDGKYREIYTEYFYEKFHNKFQIIEIPSMDNYRYLMKSSNILYLDYALISLKFIIERIRRKINQNSFKPIILLQDEFERIFQVNIDFCKIIKKTYFLKKTYVWYFEKIIKKNKPNFVVEVISYNFPKMILNEICKKKNIKTIEFQHGIIHKYHLGYDYPKNIKLKIFPDYFFSFGKYWEEKINFPIPKKQIKPVGFPHLETQIKKYKKNKTKNQILFISSKIIGKKLVNFAIQFSKLTNMKILFKLHPGEYNYWKTNYEEILNSRIIVIDHDKYPLYELISESKIIVGVSSTVLYESLAFNCEIFVVKLPSYEIFEDLFHMKLMKTVSNPKELKNKIKRKKCKNTRDKRIEYFFQKNSLKNQIDEFLNISR